MQTPVSPTLPGAATLEQTVLRCAQDELGTLQNPPAVWDDESRMDYAGSFQAAMAYCKLGHIAGSGLSDVAITQLAEIETQVTAAFVASGVMA